MEQLIGLYSLIQNYHIFKHITLSMGKNCLQSSDKRIWEVDLQNSHNATKPLRLHTYKQVIYSWKSNMWRDLVIYTVLVNVFIKF